MRYPEEKSYYDFLGHFTLLYGETDTKKTLFTSEFVKYLLEVENVNPKEISILDFAPELLQIKNVKIGGKVADYYKSVINCNYIIFEGEIIPPRLNAQNKKELYENACHNLKKTYIILKKFNEKPTKFLIINDISIFLHLGSKKYLMNTINRSQTFFGNSYYGTSINQNFTKLLSLRERKKVEYIINKIECTY